MAAKHWMIPSRTWRLKAFAGTVLLAISLSSLGALETLGLGWLDTRLAMRRWLHAHDVVPEIVLVAIDENTLERISEPLALWHRPLAAAMQTLGQLGPRAVGIDLALPDRSYDSIVPGGDETLARALAQLRQTATLILALGASAEAGQAQVPLPMFLAAAGFENNGVVLFQRDHDGKVRRFSERLGTEGERIPTLVGQLARSQGATVGEGIIDFSRGRPFSYLPLHRLVAPNPADRVELQAAIGNRVVLIGTSLAFHDRHAIPIALASWEERPDVPGLVLQAQALRSVLGGTLIRPLAPALGEALLIVALVLFALPLALGRLVSGAAALLFLMLAASTLAMEWGVDLPVVPAVSGVLAALIIRIVWHWSELQRHRRHLMSTFGGFVSPKVLEGLLDGRIDPARPQRRDLVYMFLDLRDFSGLTAKLSPEDVFAVLNRYYAAVTPCLHAHGGTIDNFRGDGLMVFFGAPEALADPVASALCAARDSIEAVERLSARLRADGFPGLRVGIAITAGEGIVGNIGDHQRSNYTALADAANVAAHLQGVARNFDCEVLATRAIAFRQRQLWQPLGSWTLKDGRAEEIFGAQAAQLPKTP